MPKILLKTPDEIQIMAEGGKILGEVIDRTFEKIKSGISTFEIDTEIDRGIEKSGAKPSFKMVEGYRHASCVGLNSEVVHSIPNKDKIVKNGDILKIDAGVFWKGFHTDSSWSVKLGNGKNGFVEDIFLATGKKALKEAIKQAKIGNFVGNISSKIQEVVEQGGYSPVKVLTGHGVGRNLHEEPFIPCFLKEGVGKTPKLTKGMTLAIEVIYNQGSAEVVLENDDWTISTGDGKISGLFELTVAITENEPLILTPTLFW